MAPQFCCTEVKMAVIMRGHQLTELLSVVRPQVDFQQGGVNVRAARQGLGGPSDRPQEVLQEVEVALERGRVLWAHGPQVSAGADGGQLANKAPTDTVTHLWVQMEHLPRVQVTISGNTVENRNNFITELAN